MFAITKVAFIVIAPCLAAADFLMVAVIDRQCGRIPPAIFTRNGYFCLAVQDRLVVLVVGGGGVAARLVLHEIRYLFARCGVINRHMAVTVPSVVDTHHIAVLRHIVGTVFNLLEALSAADKVARHIFAVAVYLDALCS